MKHLLSILLILTFSTQTFSQKKGKTKSQPKTPVAEDITPDITHIHEEVKPDTLYLEKGKKYVLLIDANQNSAQVVNSAEDTEEAELKRNFPKENLQIININKYTFVRFENLQTLDITGKDQVFQAFAYWSGKMKDKVQVKEGTRMATEFVSEHVGGKKESSYVVNTRKYKKELASLENKNKITSKSKEVMKVLLRSHSLPIPDLKSDNITVFQQGTANLESQDSYFVKKKGTRILIKSVCFNTEGQPATITHYDEKGYTKTTKEYLYKDGMLVKILDGDKIMSSISYIDNKMIFSENIGDANETKVFWLENGQLLQKSYTLMTDDKFSYMNSFVEEKIENNCTNYYINNMLWTKNCGGQSTAFPLVYTYTSFQNGEVLQFKKSKLEKKGERTFEKYYSDAENENLNDNYKLWGTFHLDDFNLVDTCNFTKDGMEQTIKIDYNCYE
jgi:hypothetical protein